MQSWRRRRSFSGYAELAACSLLHIFRLRCEDLVKIALLHLGNTFGEINMKSTKLSSVVQIPQVQLWVLQLYMHQPLTKSLDDKIINTTSPSFRHPNLSSTMANCKPLL
jgi:hypothetical protein